MFARVSTYSTGADTTSDAPADEIIRRVLEMPGCRGIYYLRGRESGTDLSITLWDSEESMSTSREQANRIRKETSDAEKRQIISVEEYEVTASSVPA